MEVIYGINAVEEALKSRGRAFDYVAVSKDRQDARLQRVIAACRSAGVPIRFEPRDQLTRIARTAAHQGVVAMAAQKKYDDLDGILAHKRAEFHFVLLLDGVEDPHNLGALMRTADAAGADGMVIPERRAVGVNATVAKASAGASEHIPVAKVTNIGRAIEEIKTQNIWVVGLDERGTQSYDEVDYRCTAPLCLARKVTGYTSRCARSAIILSRYNVGQRTFSECLSCGGRGDV